MRVFAIVTAIGLGASAVVHLSLAPPFDANSGFLVGQGNLFRVQAGVDIAAALLLVLRPRRWSAVLAGVVALGGLGLIVLTVYVPLDLTAFGLPYLFEPAWYPDKVIAAAAQALAVAGALGVAVRRDPVRVVAES